MDNRLDPMYTSALTAKMLACGLSAEQANDYVKFVDAYYEDHAEQQLPLPELPSDDCFRTLAEAQKIVNALNTRSNAPHAELFDYEIHRLLAIPFYRCEEAKAAIAACFDKAPEEVGLLYAADYEWLYLEAEEVTCFSTALKELFQENALNWKIFRDGGLLGVKESCRRITALLGLLGHEMTRKVIAADGDGWFFYRFFTDPVGFVRYMLESELAPETILKAIETNNYILYLYKQGCHRKYNHDQEYIDYLLQQFREGNFDVSRRRKSE